MNSIEQAAKMVSKEVDLMTTEELQERFDASKGGAVATALSELIPDSHPVDTQSIEDVALDIEHLEEPDFPDDWMTGKSFMSFWFKNTRNA